MRNALLVVVGIVDLCANIPYIRAALKGKTKPNIASWSTWTLINGVAAVAALTVGGALNTVLLGLSYFVGSFTILLIGLVRGTRKYTKTDVLCQSLAILGVVFWQLSNNPNIALVFAMAADVLGIIPTIYHAYFYPHEETWETFAIASGAALAFLCLSSTISFAALAVPIEFFIGNALITAVIIRRNRTLALSASDTKIVDSVLR